MACIKCKVGGNRKYSNLCDACLLNNTLTDRPMSVNYLGVIKKPRQKQLQKCIVDTCTFMFKANSLRKYCPEHMVSRSMAQSNSNQFDYIK